MSKCRYICKLCKNILIDRNPEIYKNHKDCFCISDCNFNTFIEQKSKENNTRDIDIKKMKEYWNNISYYKNNKMKY